jgi:hypothetical protein
MGCNHSLVYMESSFILHHFTANWNTIIDHLPAK